MHFMKYVMYFLLQKNLYKSSLEMLFCEFNDALIRNKSELMSYVK